MSVVSGKGLATELVWVESSLETLARDINRGVETIGNDVGSWSVGARGYIATRIESAEKLLADLREKVLDAEPSD